jgi:hypothetical protein
MFVPNSLFVPCDKQKYWRSVVPEQAAEAGQSCTVSCTQPITLQICTCTYKVTLESHAAAASVGRPTAAITKAQQQAVQQNVQHHHYVEPVAHTG